MLERILMIIGPRTAFQVEPSVEEAIETVQPPPGSKAPEQQPDPS
ncbi:hypothetical protein [Nonomuraea sp. 10N515B]